MADARTLAALGLRDGAPDWAIAGCLRQLAGLPREAPGDASLWMRVFAAIDNAVRHGDEKVDLALFAHGIACHAIAPPGDPEEDRFGVQAWDREWGVRDAESDELLRMLAIERLAPRLWNARLVYIINYV